MCVSRRICWDCAGGLPPPLGRAAAASDTPITKEVLKKLVIRVTANIFCNFLEIVIFIPLRSCRCCDVICQCFRQLPLPDVFVVCIITAGWGKTVTKICFFYGIPKLWETIIEKQEKMCYNNTDI